MKGIVFTEFMEMVENEFGFDVLDAIIAGADLPHEGLYVAGGTYPHQELVAIVKALGAHTNTEVADLLVAFGQYLFKRLISLYPHFAENKTSPIDFIASVDQIIHVEVKKLYPEAELPRFITVEHTEDKLVVDYTSKRKMELFGLGLMKGCAEHYQQPINIAHNLIDSEKHTVRFTITKAN